MQFLVRIKSNLPADYPTDKREKLLAAEEKRAQELHDTGALVATWRIAVANETVTLWEAADALQLHQWLMSLPAMPWAEARVEPVIDRNLMPH